MGSVFWPLVVKQICKELGNRNLDHKEGRKEEKNVDNYREVIRKQGELVPGEQVQQRGAGLSGCSPGVSSGSTGGGKLRCRAASDHLSSYTTTDRPIALLVTHNKAKNLSVSYGAITVFSHFFLIS